MSAPSPGASRHPLPRGESGNKYRGEAGLDVGGERLLLRPTFGALVAAAEELGSLFELVERAAEGVLKLQQSVALFDHLSRGRPPAISRERIGEAVVEKGLTGVTPTLKLVLTQILQGR